MSAYYNEFDAKTAAWLRELIKRGLIAGGEVDERSILEVQADDLKGFRQCHFFAGIGGWSYALRLAGWPDDRPVWTGSPPCQPFSAAGKRKGAADERHLWPVYARLIAQHRPPAVFGEQVGAAIGNGWLDAVFADLEAEGYACAAAVLPACSVGAPHIRQRLWFVADADSNECATNIRSNNLDGNEFQEKRREKTPNGLTDNGDAGLVADPGQPRPQGRGRAICSELRQNGQVESHRPWDTPEWIPCLDGKARPVEPGVCPLAHGIPARVVRLRGYGNAIVPQVAAEVIGAFMECQG